MIRKATGAKKPGPRGERDISRKTIARGMPGVSGVTVVTTLVCSFYFACEATGALSARHSLRLYVRGERFMNNSGVFTRRDREGVAGSHTGCLKCEGMRIRRRQPGGNEFCLRFANHKPSAKRSGLRKASGVSML